MGSSMTEEYNDGQGVNPDQKIEGWVESKVRDWRNHYESNYANKFDEYYRLWRGVWSKEDQERQSERSRLVAPALMQAVESSVAEVEEATFGRGDWFDIRDDMEDPDGADIEMVQKRLMEDFENCQVRRSISEVLINGAVFGTGIAEIVLEDQIIQKPKRKPIAGGLAQMYGVEKTTRTGVKLVPKMPQNALVDPAATTIDDAMGVAIDELVSPHKIEALQEAGVYNKDAVVGAYEQEQNLEATRALNEYSISPETGRVRLTKYYGLVPEEFGKQLKNYDPEKHLKNGFIEAIVVIANGNVLLKAQANPHFKQDRPVVAFQWDIVPSRFCGRGVCEKGYSSQKALDAEIRARIDALALTVHPMFKVKDTALSRAFDKKVYPGKIWMSTDPANDMLPIINNNISQINFAQAEAMQQMVQQATGAVESGGLSAAVSGEAKAGAVSMSLGALIKRHKRTLLNFQQSFLIPFVCKAAYRYMQYDPDRYPANDYNFVVSGTLGIMAREYEVTQLTQLMQTLPPDNPAYPILLKGTIDNMSLNDRESILKAIEESMKPDPQAQQMQMEQHQEQMALQRAQRGVFEADAAKNFAQSNKTKEETRLLPTELRIDLIKASTTNLGEGSSDDKEFEKRIRVADLMLKEKKINLDGKKIQLDEERKKQDKDAENELIRALNS